jgi:hypothetical protein
MQCILAVCPLWSKTNLKNIFSVGFAQEEDFQRMSLRGHFHEKILSNKPTRMQGCRRPQIRTADMLKISFLSL